MLPAFRTTRLLAKTPKLLLACCALFLGLEACFRAALWCESMYRRAQQPRDGAFPLYAIGDSTMTGEPYDSPELASTISPPRIVARMFDGRIAGRAIALSNLARRSESIYPQARRLERAVRFRKASPRGVLLVYIGNNEAFYGDVQTPLFETFRERWLSWSWLLAELHFQAERLDWIPRVRTLGTYGFHLRRAIELAQAHGLTPVLATVAVNLADVEPDVALGPADTPEEAVAFAQGGLDLEARGRLTEAVAFYEGEMSRRPGWGAFARFRVAACRERAGRFADAARDYRLAADLAPEGTFRRAASSQNRLLRDLAREYGLPLADAERLFAARSPHGLVGAGLMSDGHHPNMEGYLLLAGAYAEAISRLTGEPVRKRFSGAAEAFSCFSYGAREQAVAHLMRGRWLLAVSQGHPSPSRRLKMAETAFRQAVALDPENPHAWLGAGVALAALRHPILSNGDDVDWLQRVGILGDYTATGFRLAPDDLDEILWKLSGWEVPNAVLERIRRSYLRMLWAPHVRRDGDGRP